MADNDGQWERGLIEKLDIPVHGQGRIQVYYLKHADAEELAETLNSLIGGGGGSSGQTWTGSSRRRRATSSCSRPPA